MKQCGIYSIKNISNGKRYIGASRDIQVRKQVHFSSLKRSVNGNKLLQSDYLEYGKDAFEFNVIEEVPANILGARERFWIYFYKSSQKDGGYNINVASDKEFNALRKICERKAYLIKNKAIRQIKANERLLENKRLTLRAYGRRLLTMKQERLFIRASKKEKAAIKKAAKDYESISAFVLEGARRLIKKGAPCTATPAKKD